MPSIVLERDWTNLRMPSVLHEIMLYNGMKGGRGGFPIRRSTLSATLL